MPRRILFLSLFFLSIMLYFTYLRAVFLLYQFPSIEGLKTSEVLKTFIYGLKLDLSFSAYLTIIPIILISFTSIFAQHIIKPVFKVYTVAILTFLSILHIVDMELYRNWGFRIDSSILKYFNTPQEMWASSAAAPIGLLLIIFTVSIIPTIHLFNKLIDFHFQRFNSLRVYWFPAILLLLAVLIIPIRGGFQLAPINQSVAYFSSHNLLNHAALNAPWNFSQSIVDGSDSNLNPFKAMDETVAHHLIKPLYQKPKSKSIQIIDTIGKKPINVVLIIWESFTAKVVHSLGGLTGITPQFEKLIHEGVLINGMYASASRSDKGLVAILSGYPSQGRQSIMNLPAKTSKLPSLANSFQNQGYNTSYYYGGELAFANMKSYLINTGYETIIGKEQFASKDMNSKWGAHDDIVLNKLYEDLSNYNSKKPFFTTLFTLSSHEPFEVPVKAAIEGDDERSKFLNSMHYTDHAIGDFINKVQKLPLYENTIFIITADHGHRLPDNLKEITPSKYSVPFLLLGGPLNIPDTIINTVCSQTDIATTILNQLNMPSTAYQWSKDFLNNQTKQFALSTTNSGFVWIDTIGALSYDYMGKQKSYNTHNQPDSILALGKAHLQLSFQDYLNK